MLHQTDSDYLKQVAYQNVDGLDIRNDILEQYRTRHRQSWYEWLWQQLALSAHSTILDLGCGPGDLWIAWQRFMEQQLAHQGEIRVTTEKGVFVAQALQSRA